MCIYIYTYIYIYVYIYILPWLHLNSTYTCECQIKTENVKRAKRLHSAGPTRSFYARRPACSRSLLLLLLLLLLLHILTDGRETSALAASAQIKLFCRRDGTALCLPMSGIVVRPPFFSLGRSWKRYASRPQNCLRRKLSGRAVEEEARLLVPAPQKSFAFGCPPAYLQEIADAQQPLLGQDFLHA